MGYLEISDLPAYAPEANVTGKEAFYIARASALIDTHCHRGIGVSTYTERMDLTSGRSHLTYLPVVSLTSARARYDTSDNPVYSSGVTDWEDVDTDDIDINLTTGVFILPCVTGSISLALTSMDLFNTPYNEAEIVYTAGYATIPENVKIACGLIITNMSIRMNPMAVSESMPNGLRTSYRDSSFITPEIATLLSKYVAKPFR